MKYFSLLFLAVLCFAKTHAQAYEGKLLIQKIQEPVAMIELPYPPDVIENAIKDYMGKSGFKSSSTRGFDVYRGVKLDSSDAEPSDLYFKAEKKSHDKDITILTLLSAKSGQDILTRSIVTDTPQIEKSKALLNNMVAPAAATNLKVQIDLQYAALKKVQKKYNSLLSDSNDLEKKIRNLKSDLVQNRTDQQKQSVLVANNVGQDEATMKKAHKKLDNLMDDESSLQKKLRNAQSDLDQNKTDLQNQNLQVQKQQQMLDALKAKQKPPVS